MGLQLLPAKHQIRTNDGSGDILVVGSLKSNTASGGIGYTTGAGGAVTQLTNRTTGVTVNAICGVITTRNDSLAAAAAAAFTVTNSSIAVGDVVVVSIRSGSNGGMTSAEIITVAAGSFVINLNNNNTSGGTAETGTILINFVIIKAVSA